MEKGVFSMKETTKLGISVTLFATLIYVAGSISLLAMLALIVYAALMEESPFLKTVVKEASAVAIIYGFVDLVRTIIYPFIDYKFSNIISALISIMFLVCAIMAFMGNTFTGAKSTQNPGVNYYNNPAANMQQPVQGNAPVNPQMQPASAVANAENQAVCPKCGQPYAPGTVFCTTCGNKLD